MYMCIHMYMDIYIYMYAHTRIHIYIYIYTCVFREGDIDIHAHIYIYIYIYIYITHITCSTRARASGGLALRRARSERVEGCARKPQSGVRHRPNGYLARWAPSPPGKHVPLRTSRFKHMLKLPARKRLGARWAEYPFGRRRRLRPDGAARGSRVGRRAAMLGKWFRPVFVSGASAPQELFCCLFPNVTSAALSFDVPLQPQKRTGPYLDEHCPSYMCMRWREDPRNSRFGKLRGAPPKASDLLACHENRRAVESRTGSPGAIYLWKAAGIPGRVILLVADRLACRPLAGGSLCKLWDRGFTGPLTH